MILDDRRIPNTIVWASTRSPIGTCELDIEKMAIKMAKTPARMSVEKSILKNEMMKM